MSRICWLGVTVVLTVCFWSGSQLRADDSASSNASAAPNSSHGADVVDLLHKVVHAKHSLDDKGIAGNLTFVNDWSKSFLGRANSAGSINRYSLDVSVTLDTRKSIGWSGGTGFLRLKNHFGDHGGDYVGDAQGFSNIDDVSRTRLYEFWYAQKFADDRLRFKGGKIDANSDFAVVHIAGDFLNSSMGYSPTILALPTYPEPKPGVSIFGIPKQHYQAAAGWFRASEDLNMLILEGGRDWLAAGDLPGRFSLGMWRLTGPVPCFDGDELGSTQGIYVVTEQSIWRRTRPEPDGSQEVTAFLQYGHANGDVSPFTHHVGGGLVISGLLASRSHDAFGIAVTTVQFTNAPEAGYEHDRELVVETYYKIGLGRFVSLVPDVQFIHNPGGLLTNKDAVVVTPRLNISF
jgi:porin